MCPWFSTIRSRFAPFLPTSINCFENFLSTRPWNTYMQRYVLEYKIYNYYLYNIFSSYCNIIAYCVILSNYNWKLNDITLYQYVALTKKIIIAYFCRFMLSYLPRLWVHSPCLLHMTHLIPPHCSPASKLFCTKQILRSH